MGFEEIFASLEKNEVVNLAAFAEKRGISADQLLVFLMKELVSDQNTILRDCVTKQLSRNGFPQKDSNTFLHWLIDQEILVEYMDELHNVLALKASAEKKTDPAEAAECMSYVQEEKDRLDWYFSEYASDSERHGSMHQDKEEAEEQAVDFHNKVQAFMLH